MNTDSGKSLSRKEREQAARRREILEAATRLFGSQGYHGTSMNEIAREAEFSTGSLYNFFENKEELYFTLLREKVELLEEKLEHVYSGEGGVEEKLSSFAKTTIAYLKQEKYFFLIMMEHGESFQKSSKGEFSDMLREKHESYLGNMVKLMEQGISQGILKPLDPNGLALSFLGIVNSFVFVLINSSETYDLEELVGTIMDIFFNGTRRT